MSMEASLPAEITPDRPVAVIGGGRMGLAIAQIFAGAGFSVDLVEPSAEIRAAAPARLADITAKRGQPAEIADRVRLRAAIDDQLAEAGLVIEAVPERLELKQEIFRQLDALCPRAVLATNTSVIPVAEIAAHTSDPSRVVGTHFWNPPYAVRLVEVVQAIHTSAETVARTMAVMQAIGQLPVHVRKDVPGFIGNRLQHALKREAIALVENGICDAETVDFVVRNSFGARLGIMGPLEQSDLVGLGLTLDIHKVVLHDLDVSRAPQKLLVDKVQSGQTGAAVGQGFRTWTPEQAEELRQRLDRALLAQVDRGS
jgi:3-hydroxybutyryl-CoA dehydrogenase